MTTTTRTIIRRQLRTLALYMFALSCVAAHSYSQTHITLSNVNMHSYASMHAHYPLCATEDSVNCTWDARVQGNGKGMSFVALQNGASVEVLYENGSVKVFPADR